MCQIANSSVGVSITCWTDQSIEKSKLISILTTANNLLTCDEKGEETWGLKNGCQVGKHLDIYYIKTILHMPPLMTCIICAWVLPSRL